MTKKTPWPGVPDRAFACTWAPAKGAAEARGDSIMQLSYLASSTAASSPKVN
jgi:hypothetical protein